MLQNKVDTPVAYREIFCARQAFRKTYFQTMQIVIRIETDRRTYQDRNDLASYKAEIHYPPIADLRR